MREPTIRYNDGDSLEGGSIDAEARRIHESRLIRKHKGRTFSGKRLRLEGTAYAEIKVSPNPEYVIGDALSAEKIVAETDKVRYRAVTKGSSTHNIQPCSLRGNAFCIITRPLRPVRESLRS